MEVHASRDSGVGKMLQMPRDGKENGAAESLLMEGCEKVMRRTHEKEQQSAATAAAASGKPVSPPSVTSSPSREFSFAISLNPSATAFPYKLKGDPPSFAVDLSPADEIFFHGHLLPLHLLSHLPVSPRPSTHFFESSSLPSKDSAEPPKPDAKDDGNCSRANGIHSVVEEDRYGSGRLSGASFEASGRSKPKSSSSIFGLIKWRKDCESTDKQEDREKSKKKVRFDVGHVLKKYLRMVQPRLFFKGKRDGIHVRRQAYSFSAGSVSMRNSNKEVLRGRRGEYSAPASMRTSPTNSGLLVANTALSSPNDSTMEELQAAIQAAIAHCKNSIAAEKTLQDEKQSLK